MKKEIIILFIISLICINKSNAIIKYSKLTKQSKNMQSEASILIIADVDCKVSIDFEARVTILKGKSKEFKLSLGEHFIDVMSIDGKSKWKRKINLTSAKQFKIYPKLEKPETKNATLIIIADMDCKLTIDFEKNEILSKDEKFSLSISLGEHFLKATTKDGKYKWSTKINIKENKTYKITTRLKSKIIQKAPVLIIVDMDCDIDINGKQKISMQADDGRKIMLIFGEHSISAVSRDKSAKWNKKITINKKTQSIVNVNLKKNIKEQKSPTKFKDFRDGKTYKIIKIGQQTWMAENLKYNIGHTNSWCYKNKMENCRKYGRLYNNLSKKKICPNGWHLPSKSDWEKLINYLGGEKIAGGKLKSLWGWKKPNNDATNSSKFTIFPGGYRYSEEKKFYSQERNAFFWTSTIDNKDYAWYCRLFYKNGKILLDSGNRKNGFSVRCIKD